MAVRIVTDSACDLPQDVCDELGIEVVPLTIRFGDEEYVDRKELSTDDVLARSSRRRRCCPRPRRRRSARSRRRSAACRRRRRRHRLHQPVRARCRRRCSRRRSPRRRSTGCARSRSSTRRARRWASATSCCTPRARAADGADARRRSSREVEERRDRQHLFAALDTLEYLRKGGRIGGAQACSARCCRSSRSSASSTARSSRPGKVRTRSKALQLHRRPDSRRATSSDLRAARRRARHRRVPRDARARGARRRDRRRQDRAGRSACTPARGCIGVAWIEAG